MEVLYRMKFYQNLGLHLVILSVALFVAYWKVLHSDFISWDDMDYVFNIKDLSTGISFENIKYWFTKNYLGNYQPLPAFSYAIDHALAGTEPGFYHLHSLLWHLATTFLVYCFIYMLCDDLWIAFFVALLFAIHPVQTESVSWVAARNKSMNGFFYFAAICFYISYVKTHKTSKLIFVTLCGLLAYLCKATALALPPALFAIDIWLNRSLNSRKLWLEKLPLILVGIPVAIATLMAQKDVNFLQHHGEFGWSNIVLAGYALVQYLIHLGFPVDLSVLYPYPTHITFVHLLYFFIALLLVACMVILYKKGQRVWAAGIFFFMINLAPVLQLVQFGEQLMADRYLYIACIGIWFPLVYHVFKLTHKKFKSIGIGSLIFVSIIFFVMTSYRNTIWLNNITFWGSIIKTFPESSVAHYSIGGAYMNNGDLSNAELHMNKAVYYDQKNYKAWRNKGSLHMRQGRQKEALFALNQSLALYPYSKAYFTRAVLYQNMQHCELALKDIQKVLQQEPENARAYYIKGDCEEKAGNTREALDDYSAAISYDGLEPLFLIRRGLLFAKGGNNQAAFNDLDKAIALQPGNGEALYYRAILRYNLKQSPCEDLRKAQKCGYKPAASALQKICK